jgi:hypothetical protein
VEEIQQNKQCSINVKNDPEDIPTCFITPTSKKIKQTIMIEDVTRLTLEFFQPVKRFAHNEVEDSSLSL